MNIVFERRRRCTNPGPLVAQVTIFCKVVPNIGEPSVWKLLHGTFLAFRILRWLLKFWTIFRPVKSKGKCKVHPRTGNEGPEGEQMYSSTLPSTSALDGVSGQRHALAALPPGKFRYPFYRRLCGPQVRSGRVRKILPPRGFDTRTVQPVASRYTD